MASEQLIPQKYVDLAREMCALAAKHQVQDMTVTFQPNTWREDQPWQWPIVVSWSQGRHGADVDKMHVTSQVFIHTTVQDPLGKELSRGKEG